MNSGALSFVLCVCLAFAAADAVHFELDVNRHQEDARASFKAWTTHFSKTYEEGTEEFELRFGHWKENIEHLLAKHTCNGIAVSVNGLMDMHDDEFKQAYLGYSHQKHHHTEEGYRMANLTYRYRWVQPAEQVDWRKQGILGPIKDQHVNGTKCGCCWTFATTGVVEAINAMATGKVESVSEQQLIDCDKAAPYYDLGCQGGDFGGGITYIINNGGIALESDYPYLAKDAKCQAKLEKDRAVTVDAFETVPGGNETALMQAVSIHPVATGVCVGPWIKEWRAYTGGIFHAPENCEEPQDHAIVIVGYGEEDNGDKYWLIKNSWSLSWGEEGFLKLPRGMPGNGSLGLAATPGYPIKISPNPHHALPTNTQPALCDYFIDLGRRAIDRFSAAT